MFYKGHIYKLSDSIVVPIRGSLLAGRPIKLSSCLDVYIFYIYALACSILFLKKEKEVAEMGGIYTTKEKE